MVIENPYDAEWSWSGPNEPLDVPAKETAAWYRPFIAEIQAQESRVQSTASTDLVDLGGATGTDQP